MSLIIKLVPLFLLVSLLTACKDKQASEPVVAKNATNQTKEAPISTKSSKKTILCFGNSLTAGHGLEEKDAWPFLLQQRIDSLGLPYTVANAGLSGDISSGGLARLDWVLKQKIDVFFLELGANDMLRGLDVTKTKENLDAILAKVRTKNPGIPIIIAGMLAPPNMGADYEQAFNKIFPTLSQKYDAKLIPFFLKDVAGIKALNNADGIHPNAEGSKIVLEHVWGVMEGIVILD